MPDEYWSMVSFLDAKDCQLFGDQIIGYRVMNFDGEYLDDELEDIYENIFMEDCELFNSVCERLKSGKHNW